MKEVTRIHIAKVAYDIEVPAKKALETYVRQLELYADDSDVMVDVETRMTELLHERRVAPGGVVSGDDVDALREQLGEPQDFASGDGDIAIGPDDVRAISAGRRLYRDGDRAVIGGVLAGLAAYVKISPLWTRLAFIILLLVSFGTVAIVYFVLWLAIPKAQTAAEKLQLAGEPVTLASLKARRDELEMSSRNYNATTQRIVLFLAGLFGAVAAAGALVTTIVAGFMLASGSVQTEIERVTNMSWVVWLVAGLFILSGLLLTALFSLLAYASFVRSFSRRVAIAVVSVVVAGVITFTSGVALLITGYQAETSRLYNSRTTKTESLPANFSGVKQLVIDRPSETIGYTDSFVVYRVSNSQPRYELEVDDSTKQLTPRIVISGDGRTATLTINDNEARRSPFGAMSQPRLIIYGPALSDLTVNGGSANYQSSATEAVELDVTASRTAFVSLVGGRYSVVTATVGDSGTIGLDGVVVERLAAIQNGGTVTAGVVRQLEVTLPEACAAGVHRGVTVDGISSERIQLNGKELPGITTKRKCGTITVGNEDEPVEGFRAV